ncbi:MAG TPA: T9SS type A sorting domain-containing protein [Candidatus Kryptonia bacterium]
MKVDSSRRVPTPEDSTGWKKLKGDALYALGTPWSSSSPILYVSRDSVETWQVDTSGINGAKIQDINLDTLQYVYAATDNGLFIQNPDSNVWHRATFFTQATNLYSVFIDRKDRILVSGNGGGLYISTDNGASWNSDASGVGSNQVLLIADDAYNNLYISAGTSIFSFGAHIYKSMGGTSSWVEIDSSITRIVSSASFQNMQINSLSGDSILVAGTSFGVFVSTDQGTTWAMNNNGIKAENFSGMVKTGSGKILMSSALGIFSNTPPDTVWDKTYPQNGFEGQLPLVKDGLGNIYTLDPEIFLHSGNGAIAIVKSTDAGSTWSPDTLGLSAVNGGLFYVDETGAQHYGGGHQFFGTNPDLWTKPVSGSWTIDTTGFPTQSTNYVACMTSDRNGFLYISGNLSGKKVMRRPVGGGTWAADTSGVPSSVPSFVQMVPGTNGDVFAVGGPSGSGIMRRSGGTWSTLSLPSSPTPAYVTALSVDNSGVLFAGFADANYMGLGVYFSTDNGTSWSYDGLDSVIATSLLSFGDSTYALTDGEGAFYLGKSPATKVTGKSTAPSSFALYQNYPNPFNPTTVISYRLPVGSHVTLKVYDVLGREVATLVDGLQNQGKHEVTFEGSRFASGVYFYRLSAEGQVRVSKMLLLK